MLAERRDILFLVIALSNKFDAIVVSGAIADLTLHSYGRRRIRWSELHCHLIAQIQFDSCKHAHPAVAE